MLLGFHGATTMTSDLETDVRVSREAGYKGLELWADKVYKFLESHSLAESEGTVCGQRDRPVEPQCAGLCRLPWRRVSPSAGTMQDHV